MHNEEQIRVVIQDFEGIVPFNEIFYIESIIYTAERALNAFRRYEDGLEVSRPAEVVIGSIQEALTHAAALSRFFWPIRDKGVTKYRGNKLRKAFELDDTSVLKSSELRHALEHYDERLDSFLVQEHVGNFYPDPIVGLEEMNDDQLLHIFRLIDYPKEVFILLGKKYNFSKVNIEVRRIYEKALKMKEKGGRLNKL